MATGASHMEQARSSSTPRAAGRCIAMKPYYPITITEARYGGTYEGAEWVAFHLHPQDIPEEAFGDDSTCLAWWLDYGEGVGKGATPEDARASLVRIEEPLQMLRGPSDGEHRLMRAPWRSPGETV
jgi:hypothetical protein